MGPDQISSFKKVPLANGGDGTLGGERRAVGSTIQLSRREVATRPWPRAVWWGAELGLPICTMEGLDEMIP